MKTQEITALSPETKQYMALPMFGKRELRALIVPLIIEQALSYSIGMIDTVMVASVGESAVSGVSLVDAINVLIITVFTALATGGAIVAGQYLGMKEEQNARHAAKHLLLAAFALSVLVAAACVLLRRPLLSLLFGQAEAAVLRHAATYLAITALSYPFIALYNAAAALFRGMGNGKVPMMTSFVMNVVNLIGNAVLIFGLGLGVFGAALATLLSRIVAAVCILCLLRRRALPVHVRSYSPRGLELSMIRRILRIGVPSGLENGIFHLGRIVMTSLVATFGTTAIAANAVGGSLTVIGIIPGMAMGLALLSVTARCIGAGEEAQAVYFTKMLVGRSWRYMIVMNTLLMLLSYPALGLYHLSHETFVTTMWIMVIHTVGTFTVWAPSFTLPHALRAAGDVRFPMFISIGSMFVFRVGCSYALAYTTELGVLCVWFAMILDWTVRAICFALRWRSGRWRAKQVLR